MTNNTSIRLERESDFRNVENLTREAFEAQFPQKEKKVLPGQLPTA